MDRYFAELGLRLDRSGMPEGYNGPQIDRVWREENIELLSKLIVGDARTVAIVEGCQDYILRLKELYAMCVRYFICLFHIVWNNLDHYQLIYSKELPEDYVDTCHNFRVMFDHLYDMGFLSETPKIHILYSHLQQYLTIQKRAAEDRGEHPRSLALGDCQGLEACHMGLRKSDKRHGCVIQHVQVCQSDSPPASVLYQLSLLN